MRKLRITNKGGKGKTNSISTLCEIKMDYTLQLKVRGHQMNTKKTKSNLTHFRRNIF